MLFLCESALLLEPIPGNPSLVSPRGIGVAIGSTETTERTGNTLSVASGLRAELLGPEICDAGLSMAAERIVTELFLDSIPVTDVFGLLLPGVVHAVGSQGLWLSMVDFSGV
jgi:hypothetical protein